MIGPMDTPPASTPQSAEGLGLDPLTGLQNESILRGRLPEEFARARAREANGALIAVKLDNVVAINRMHGRAGGDEALRAVAYLLANYRAVPGREAHIAFRVGGPVFGYCIPSCSAPQARQVAEDIHRLVMESELCLDRLTVSIGITNFYEFFLEEGTREDAALRVEQTAFYRLSTAEHQGGNTICDSSGTAAEIVGDRPRVLLVEPDPPSMELLVRALQAADLVVDVREDGESAMESIGAKPPSVIICEAMTPRMDGFALREQLRTKAAWNEIPFVLVSHKKNEDLVRRAVEHDIRHFFRKPVSLAEVVGLVANITRRASR